jgi:hypothetical protein
MLRVSGLLPTGCKMLDTPGVPHPHQVGGWVGVVLSCAVQRSAGLDALFENCGALFAGQRPTICFTAQLAFPSPLCPAACLPPCLQLAGHLTAEEMRMVLPRRQLKPRTFRIGKGQVRGAACPADRHDGLMLAEMW